MHNKKIYVASSWRNNIQQDVVQALRSEGFNVYDFKHPMPNNTGFHWSEIDPNWKDWNPSDFIHGLTHPVAEAGYGSDMSALINCDICVLVLPCGRSTHLEAGYAAGARKKLFILVPEPIEPELMYKMATGICTSIDELQAMLSTCAG